LWAFKKNYNMKYLISLSLILLSCFTMSAQEHIILTNKITAAQLLEHSDFDFTAPVPESPAATDRENRELLKQYNIIVFLGTWCGDSRELLPEIYAYFRKLEIPQNDITYYGLDETKLSSDQWEDTYNIEFVPTILFIDKKSGEEKGRIVERFEDSIYNDIHTLLQP